MSINAKLASVGLLIIGTILTIGGIVLALTGSDIPEWLGKTIAIIVGALVALAGGQALAHKED